MFLAREFEGFVPYLAQEPIPLVPRADEGPHQASNT